MPTPEDGTSAWQDLTANQSPEIVADLRQFGDLSVQRYQAQLREDGLGATTIHDNQGEILDRHGEEFRTKAIMWGRVAIATALELQPAVD